jgi:hypothetical protein
MEAEHLLSGSHPSYWMGAKSAKLWGCLLPVLTEKSGEQGNEGHADQRNTAASHELFHALTFCLCVIKK